MNEGYSGKHMLLTKVKLFEQNKIGEQSNE